ncbi:MAG: xanthine dehydrogenase accessory protein XdhC [Pseudomonadota bacterium]
MDLGGKAAELKLSNVPFCWVTIVKSSGSTPRGVGAKMIVTSNGSFGTIGGGALEHRAMEDAREQMRRRTPECRSYPLGPLLGQCCGGEVDLFMEPVIPPKPVHVFGAGHIAEALVPMLAEVGFSVTLIDERPDRIGLPCFLNVPEKWNELPSDVFGRIKFNDETHIIVITHEHKHDEEIVRLCLDKPFKYLGCIGSRTKWEKFKARYRAQGVTDEQIRRVSTPIGLDIGAETPFEIAVAIVAELIQLHAK